MSENLDLTKYKKFEEKMPKKSDEVLKEGSEINDKISKNPALERIFDQFSGADFLNKELNPYFDEKENAVKAINGDSELTMKFLPEGGVSLTHNEYDRDKNQRVIDTKRISMYRDVMIAEDKRYVVGDRGYISMNTIDRHYYNDQGEEFKREVDYYKGLDELNGYSGRVNPETVDKGQVLDATRFIIEQSSPVTTIRYGKEEDGSISIYTHTTTEEGISKNRKYKAFNEDTEGKDIKTDGTVLTDGTSNLNRIS